jgi:hypothetical protein
MGPAPAGLIFYQGLQGREKKTHLRNEVKASRSVME